MLVVCGGSGGDSCCEGAKGPLEGPGVEAAAPVCAGCGGGIQDRYYLLAVDRRWHIACLTCCQCKVRLDSEITCFARDGRIYCKKDYYRMFPAKRCTRCHLSISPSELVNRAREHVYHLHCFTCATCNHPLTKGEYFGLREDVIYCRQHYEMLLQYERPYSAEQQQPKAEDDDHRVGEGPHHPSDFPLGCELGLLQQQHQQDFQQQQQRVGSSGECPGRPPSAVLKTPGQKGRPRKQKSFLASSLLLPLRGPSIGGSPDSGQCVPGEACPVSGVLLHGSVVGSDSSTSSEHLARPKRMRTSFKHHQLRAMKSYFAINHNPDAKDLKQLSQKTGLSKRVLQVWFQNARAKWRRNLLRQQSQGPEVAQDCKPLSELPFCDPFLSLQPTPITQEEQDLHRTFTSLL